MSATPREHPVFGQLVPDAWGGLVTLRRFPFLPEFALSLDDATAGYRPLIAEWERHIPKLAPQARDFSLRGGLHREGVFEVYVSGERGEDPSDAQVAAFAGFLADEEHVCRNLVDAMLRYYRAARREIPDYFIEPPFRGEYPNDPDAAALARVLEFDSLTVSRTAAAGMSPLIFSWGPEWDLEHGLSSLVYNGQVLLVGTDDVDEMMSEPRDDLLTLLIWNRSIMTPAEIAAYEAYRSGHEGDG